jgi:hypothetical protein
LFRTLEGSSRPKKVHDHPLRPVSALEAILQALDSESVTWNDNKGRNSGVGEGEISGKSKDSARLLLTSEGSLPDQRVSHNPFPDNSPVVPWRRGGGHWVRRPPSLVKIKARVAPAPMYNDDDDDEDEDNDVVHM